MGLPFKFGRAVSEIFEFQCSKKGDLFRQDLERSYLSRMAPKGTFLMVFFFQFSGNKHS